MSTGKQLQSWSDFLMGIVAVAAAAAIAYAFIAGIVHLLTSMASETAKAVIAASATIIVSVLTLIASKRLEVRAKLLQEIREKKMPSYEKLIAFMFDIIFHDKMGKKKPTDQHIVQHLTEFAQRLIVWGSDDVIKAYGVFRSASLGQTEPADMMDKYELLLKAMRKDLGHSDNLPKGTLLSLFINKEEKKDGP